MIATRIKTLSHDRITRANYSTVSYLSKLNFPQCGTEILKKRLYEYGFSVITSDIFNGQPESLQGIFDLLKLGKPFVPEHYNRENPYFHGSGINTISAQQFSKYPHRGFASQQAQAVHVDGTLQDIGKIKTSIIACVQPAPLGGESIIFNSTAAFFSILNNNSNYALALLDNRALTRTDIGRTGMKFTSSVFAIQDNQIFTRFSLDNTCTWNLAEVPFLKEAKDMLETMLLEPKFVFKYKLQANEILILLNSKISHGRNEFNDTLENKRLLFRALFECSP